MVECDFWGGELFGAVFGDEGDHVVVYVEEDVHWADHVEGLEGDEEEADADFAGGHGGWVVGLGWCVRL